jgi:hypothetical protein
MIEMILTRTGRKQTSKRTQGRRDAKKHAKLLCDPFAPLRENFFARDWSYFIHRPKLHFLPKIGKEQLLGI